uniref:Uncharacterized protein n=1 Tax=Oryza meridionalis TaxID=40149 RepID=A0A0E0D1M5_9ORYZ
MVLFFRSVVRPRWWDKPDPAWMENTQLTDIQIHIQRYNTKMVFLKIMLPFANLCAIPVLRKMARDGGHRGGVLRGASWKPPRRSLTSPSPTWARPSTSRFGAYHPESECWAAPLTTTPDVLVLMGTTPRRRRRPRSHSGGDNSTHLAIWRRKDAAPIDFPKFSMRKDHLTLPPVRYHLSD